MNKKQPTTKKKAKFELSAGAVIINPKRGEILMIIDQKDRFSFPKGNNEKGETMIETAKREASEETGVKNLQFIAKLGEVDFFYKLKADFIFKKVAYFLFKTKSTKIKPELEEIKDACWIKTNKVKGKIPFKNLQNIWENAQKLIN